METEIDQLSQLKENFKNDTRNVIGSFRKIFLFSIVTAWIFTILTCSLSPVYFTDITAIATGDKKSLSKAAVVWLSTPKVAELQMKNFIVRKSPGWRESKMGIFVSTRDQPAELHLQGYLPDTQVLRFVKTPYAGEVKLDINGFKKTISLFGDKPGLITIKMRDYLNEENRSIKPGLFQFCVVYLRNFLCLFLFGVLFYPVYARFHLPALQPSSTIVRSRSAVTGKILLLLAFLIFGLFVVAFYPGTMASDAYQQYLEAVLFRFDDWHPPIMALLWSFINKMIPGAAGMFLLHLTIGIVSFYLLARVAYLKGKRLSFWPILLLLLPIVSCLMFNIIKDVSSALSMLFSFSLWYYWSETGRLTKLKVLLILGALFYGSAVRLNALPAALPLIFLYISPFVSRRKALVFTLVIGALFHFGNNFLCYGILRAKKIYTIQAIMTHDLLGIYRYTGRNYFPERYLTKQHVDSLMTRYDPISLDPTTWVKDAYMTTNPEIIAELKQAWIKALFDEPMTYLMDRWFLYRSFLKDVVYVIQEISYPEPDFLPEPAHPLLKETSLGKLHTKLVFWIYGNAPVFYMAITYLITTTALFLFSLRCRNNSVLALNLSSLFYLAPYYFFAPAANYRYVYWCMLTTLVSLVLFWIDGPRSRADYIKGSELVVAS